MPETELTERLKELEKNWIFHEQLYDFEGAECLRLATGEAVRLLLAVHAELMELKGLLKKEQLPSCEFDQA